MALSLTDPQKTNEYNEILRGLAWAHYHQKDYRKAIDFFNQSLEFIDPSAHDTFKNVLFGIGWANMNLSCFNEAIGAFNKVPAHNNSKETQKELTSVINLATIGKKVGQLNDTYLSTWRWQVNSSTPLTEFELPEIIEIEPTLNCNLRCIMCHVSYQNLEKEVLDVKFVKRLKGLEGKWVILGANFEPAIHPHFVDMARALTDLGMNLELITNGTLFTQEKSNQLKDCNFRSIINSFDGIRKETYESIRRNANYDQAIERILYFKNNIKNKDAYFSINNTLMKRNIDELIETVDFWEQHGFDHLGLILMALRDTNEMLTNESLESLKPYTFQRIEEAGRHLIERNYRITLSSSAFGRPSCGLATEYPSNLLGSCVKSGNPRARTPFNPRTYFQNGEFPGMPVGCRSPFKSCRILWNGDVEMCYKFIIGNIYQKDLVDIWYGETARKYRQMVMRSADLCHACEYYNSCIKGGEVDYDKTDSFRDEKLRNFYSKPTRLEAFHDYNIVAYKDCFYGLPTRAGEIDLYLDDSTKIKGVVTADSLDALKEKLEDHHISNVPHLFRTMGSYNITRFKGRYYALPQCLGEVNWKREKEIVQMKGVFVDHSLEMLRTKISARDPQESAS